MIIESNSREETYKVGIQLGKDAVSGQVYCIYGDLGVGKTIISQGVAAGLGITEVVNSPTFTIVKEYDEGRLPLYHFDVYRLEDVDEFFAIGGDEYFERGICIIEWGELIKEALPKNYIEVTFSRDFDDDKRQIIIENVVKDF